MQHFLIKDMEKPLIFFYKYVSAPLQDIYNFCVANSRHAFVLYCVAWETLSPAC